MLLVSGTFVFSRKLKDWFVLLACFFAWKQVHLFTNNRINIVTLYGTSQFVPDVTTRHGGDGPWNEIDILKISGPLRTISISQTVSYLFYLLTPGKEVSLQNSSLPLWGEHLLTLKAYFKTP